MVHILIGCREDISGILEERIRQLDAGIEGLCSAVQAAAALTPHKAWKRELHHIETFQKSIHGSSFSNPPIKIPVSMFVFTSH